MYLLIQFREHHVDIKHCCQTDGKYSNQNEDGFFGLIFLRIGHCSM